MLLMSAGCLHRHKTVAIQTYPPPVPSNPPAAPKAPQPSAPSGAAAAPSSPGGQLPQNLPGEEGIASWYGPPFNGRASASGEIYNMYDFTAAHRTLPFGTQVRVHNLDNGQTVDVRINDRGPFIEGRIIDLSYSAAEALHMIGPGTAQVRLEILNPGLIAGPAAEPGIFAVQVGAFRNLDNAEQMKARLQNQFGPVVIQSFDRGNGLFHRVRVGHESTEEAAHVLETQLQQAGIARQTFVVRLN